MAEIMGIDHRVGDAGLGQPVEGMVEEGAAGESHQRLGPGFGQRPHAKPEPGGKHHGAPGRAGACTRHHAAGRHGGTTRAAAGMRRSIHSRMGASPGWPSAASSKRHTLGMCRR